MIIPVLVFILVVFLNKCMFIDSKMLILYLFRLQLNNLQVMVMNYIMEEWLATN